jgi:hypothetical protein
MAKQLFDIALATCKHVVDAKDIMPLLNQTITQMAPKKSGSAGDQDSL